MTILRVCLRNTDVHDERIRFDVSVDEVMKPLSEIAYFGYCGSLNDTEYSTAMMLCADGIIDSGCGFDTRARYHRTNLLTKRIKLGEYITIWWSWGNEPIESTFMVEAATVLSAVTESVTIQDATKFYIESISALPRFRARVVKTFNIVGFDNVVYRPPIGVEGMVAAHTDTSCIFFPDNAISKSGAMISAVVNLNHLELIIHRCNAGLMAGLGQEEV
jgi:hypothetical protein